mmetsp:Transcript_45078/g.104259  ORF Transcript_45078/g.104259 Transcript_45078/m.104259 type:complete len:225 (+) Transcript_45078:1271-1945(+)
MVRHQCRVGRIARDACARSAEDLHEWGGQAAAKVVGVGKSFPVRPTTIPVHVELAPERHDRDAVRGAGQDAPRVDAKGVRIALRLSLCLTVVVEVPGPGGGSSSFPSTFPSMCSSRLPLECPAHQREVRWLQGLPNVFLAELQPVALRMPAQLLSWPTGGRCTGRGHAALHPKPRALHTLAAMLLVLGIVQALHGREVAPQQEVKLDFILWLVGAVEVRPFVKH